MRIDHSGFWRGLTSGLVGASIGAIILIPFLVWGSDNAPAFFGAFTAAIVAAIAVFMGAYTQAKLTRKRDEELRRQQQIADATELCFWLEHAAGEMDFIAGGLEEIQLHLIKKQQDHLTAEMGQFRAICHSNFMDEIPTRIKVASNLKPALAHAITGALYTTMRSTERNYLLKGAVEQFRPSIDYLKAMEDQTRRHALSLRAAYEVLAADLGLYKASEYADTILRS